jgi:hypothetical protein
MIASVAVGDLNALCTLCTSALAAEGANVKAFAALETLTRGESWFEDICLRLVETSAYIATSKVS